MIRKLLFFAALPVSLTVQSTLMCVPAAGQSSTGNIAGVVRDASGQPVAAAQVLAHNLTSGASLAAFTSSDGVFKFELESGRYELATVRDGFQRSTSRVKVTAGKTIRFDVSLAANPVNGSQVASELAAMKARIDQLEAELKARNAPQQASSGLLATTTTDPNLLPRFPMKRDPLATVALNGTPSQTQSAPPTSPAASPEKPAASIPDALQAPESTPGVDNFTPFAYGDFTWLNGSPRNKDTVLDTKFFTPEVRFDTHYMEDFNQPKDHTIVGATESFRSGEVQVEQISVGGDFHWQNVRGRVLYMSGLFASTTPRNDASSATASYPGNSGGVGQWDLQNAYRYVSEAYGGYHFNVNHGLNVDAGIFVSYIGLFSYYNFDNWTYQPSYVSSNTPWFFNGVRLQWFPTNKLKIEPWFINGWQSYAKFNGRPGVGGQLLWMPKEWLKVVANQYAIGQDNLGLPKTERIHTDDSIEIRYYNKPESTGLSKMAISITGDAGCEHGGGLSCGGHAGPKESFLGWMVYNRFWFNKDKYAITVGGGAMDNPGRYLTLLPPINGATAASGTPYFTENPGDRAHMWDSTITFHYMPRQYITWWAEVGYRHSDIPYFAGRGGVTPPGGNNGVPSQFVCNSGAAAGTNDLATAYTNCGGAGSVWFPDLRRSETKVSVGVMVKF